MLPPEPGTRRADRAAAASIALAALIAIALARPRLALAMNWDATHVYLPMARELLARGLAFFSDPSSVRMAPLAYAYPALLGADAALIRTVNVGLYGAIVVMVAGAAWTAHSRRAAVLAAYLTALSPMIRLWVADVMTEPIFLVLVAAWILALARIAAGAARGWIVAAALAFAAASLTRPAASLLAPVLAAAFALEGTRESDPVQRGIDRRIATAHALATLAWLAWLAHNAWQFHFPAIASGEGTALWLGMNPLTDGFDPFYYGLTYDDGPIVHALDHLSIEGDRRLHAAAMLQVRELPWGAIASLALHKVWAFLFATPFDVWDAPVGLVRAWRVPLVGLAVVAIARLARSRVVQAAAVYVAYMLAVHAPLLFTVRYSVALDVPLGLLAALGLAECLRDVRWGAPVAFAIAIALGITMPAMALRTLGSPRLEHAIVKPLWQDNLAGNGVRMENMQPSGTRAFLARDGAALELALGAPGFQTVQPTLMTLEVAQRPLARHARCSFLRLRFREPDAAAFGTRKQVWVPLAADERMHRYAVGATHPLDAMHQGVLRIEWVCDGEVEVELGRIALYEAARAPFYDARLPPMAQP